MTRSATARAQDDADPLVFNEAEGVRTAVENASVAVMMVDRDLTITYLNTATRELLAANADASSTNTPSTSGACCRCRAANPTGRKSPWANCASP